MTLVVALFVATTTLALLVWIAEPAHCAALALTLTDARRMLLARQMFALQRLLPLRCRARSLLMPRLQNVAPVRLRRWRLIAANASLIRWRRSRLQTLLWRPRRGARRRRRPRAREVQRSCLPLIGSRRRLVLTAWPMSVASVPPRRISGSALRTSFPLLRPAPQPPRRPQLQLRPSNSRSRTCRCARRRRRPLQLRLIGFTHLIERGSLMD